MRRILGSLVCVIVIGLLPAAEANAGWVIEQVVRSRPGAPTGGGDQDRQVLMMSADRIKTTTLDRTGKPTSAWIMDLAAQTLTSVDYDRRTVATGTVREFAESMQGTMQAVGGQMAEAMKQMQEAMKEMSPEQRQMMEQMMRQSMPGGSPPGGAPPVEACREPKVEIRPTGQTERIAGYQASRYDVFEDGKLAEELWVSKAITAWQEIDPKKLERFGQEMAKAMESLPGCGRDRARRAGADPNDPAWKLAGEGYPVRNVDRRRGEGTVTEVVKADNRAVPLVEFQPPAGFTRQSFRELMGGGQ
jgi:hypothetical protein